MLLRGSGTEPDSLDPQKARSVESQGILRDLCEGLTTLDKAVEWRRVWRAAGLSAQTQGSTPSTSARTRVGRMAIVSSQPTS